MKIKKNFWLGVVAALALAAAGCSDDSGSGGTAGMGGNGGMGGMETPMGSITAVHLAPEVPAAGATDVTIYVNGTAAASSSRTGCATPRAAASAVYWSARTPVALPANASKRLLAS